MDISLKNRLIETVVDKALIGLLILLAGSLVNSSLERYKLIEAQRVGDTSDLVKACADIWGKVYEYEAILTEIDEMKFKRPFAELIDKDAGPRLEESISAKTLVGKQLLEKVETMLNERRFVIGDDLVLHYKRYIGVLHLRSNIRNDVREGKLGESINDSELIEAFDKELAAMRFTALAAREHAISKLPR